MNKIWRVTAAAALALAVGVGAVACSSDADVASSNLSKDAENFKINRRIVFYNGITDTYILVVEGFCSVESEPENKLAVTCKTAVKGQDGAKDDLFKKHFLGKSDNVTWFAEQLDSAGVSTSHYRVIFKPSTILPDVEQR